MIGFKQEKEVDRIFTNNVLIDSELEAIVHDKAGPDSRIDNIPLLSIGALRKPQAS